MRSISPAALTAALLILPVAGVANDDEVMENMTVTASRTPIPIAHAGASVTILGREDVAASGATTLVELLRDVPGLAVSQQGPLGALAQVRVRGAEANHVLVMVDGVEVNDLAQGSEYNFAHLNLAAVERVEVLRGPQSALWGSDALAGVVHVTTVGSDPGARGSIGVAVGTNGTGQGGARYASGGFAAYADWFETDGTNVSRQGTEDDGYENLTIGASYMGRIADGARLSVNLRHVGSENEYDGFDFVTTGLPADAAHVTEREALHVSARLEVEGRVQHRFSLSRSDTDNVNKSGGVPSISRGTRDQLQYQLGFGNAVHALAVVAELEREDYDQRGFDAGFGNPNRDLDVDARSFGFEYRFSAGAVNTSLSARHDDNSDFDDAVSWRGGIAFEVWDGLTVFGSVGEAVKNPSFVERFGFFDTFIGNPDLEPERSESMELGARLTGDRYSIELALFDAELGNEINGFVFDPGTGGTTAANVSGTSERRGFEARVVAELAPTLSVHASVTVLDAEQPGAPGTTTEVRRPERSGSAGLRWKQSDWTVALTANFVGEQHDDFFPPAPPFRERVTLDNFVVFRAHARWQVNDALALTADATNLLDEDYEEVFGFRAPGRVVRAGIRFSF